jgi:hypothetical protein
MMFHRKITFQKSKARQKSSFCGEVKCGCGIRGSCVDVDVANRQRLIETGNQQNVTLNQQQISVALTVTGVDWKAAQPFTFLASLLSAFSYLSFGFPLVESFYSHSFFSLSVGIFCASQKQHYHGCFFDATDEWLCCRGIDCNSGISVDRAQCLFRSQASLCIVCFTAYFDNEHDSLQPFTIPTTSTAPPPLSPAISQSDTRSELGRATNGTLGVRTLSALTHDTTCADDFCSSKELSWSD